MIDLVCPYCKGRLTVNLERAGRPYLSYEVAESIECDDWKCGAEWYPDGQARAEGRK